MSKSRAAIRTVKILELVAEYPNGLTMSEIASDLDIPVTSVNDIIKALVDMDMLDLIDSRSKTYGIGLKAFYIGNAYIHNTSLIDRAKPVIQELGSLLNKTVFLGKHANGKVTYLHKHEAPGVLIATCAIGSQTTMHNTALGKSILAYDLDALAQIDQNQLAQKTKYTITDFEELRSELALVRDRGYAIDDREHNEHLLCVGAPIFDSSGRVIAALSISSLYSPDRDVDGEASLVREKANEISMKMGWREPLTI
ncbi:MAG: IclR family transcriptional regulator [Chloroflexota bacterium]